MCQAQAGPKLGKLSSQSLPSLQWSFGLLFFSFVLSLQQCCCGGFDQKFLIKASRPVWMESEGNSMTKGGWTSGMTHEAPRLEIQNYMSLIRAAGRDGDIDRAFAILKKLQELPWLLALCKKH